MKTLFSLCFLLLFLSTQAQTTISIKAGLNPSFLDAGQNYRREAWTLKGGWGYRAGADMSYQLTKRWSFFHGAALSINKLKYSHSGYSAITGLYNSYVEGYQSYNFSIPVGFGYHYKIAKIPSQLRGLLEWNTGVFGNVNGYQTDFTSIGHFDRKIDFLNRETTSDGTLKHNRFSIGFESITQIIKPVSIDIGYTYGLTDVMFNSQLPGKRSRLHSLFAGINCTLFRYNKRN